MLFDILYDLGYLLKVSNSNQIRRRPFEKAVQHIFW